MVSKLTMPWPTRLSFFGTYSFLWPHLISVFCSFPLARRLVCLLNTPRLLLWAYSFPLLDHSLQRPLQAWLIIKLLSSTSPSQRGLLWQSNVNKWLLHTVMIYNFTLLDLHIFLLPVSIGLASFWRTGNHLSSFITNPFRPLKGT